MWGVALQAAPSSAAATEHAFERLCKKAGSDQRSERVFTGINRKIEQPANLMTGEAYFRHFHEDQLNSGPHVLQFSDGHPTLLPVRIWENARLG